MSLAETGSQPAKSPGPTKTLASINVQLCGRQPFLAAFYFTILVFFRGIPSKNNRQLARENFAAYHGIYVSVYVPACLLSSTSLITVFPYNTDIVFGRASFILAGRVEPRQHQTELAGPKS